MLDKLKYVEGNLEKQTRNGDMLTQEIEQLKRMHKNTSERLADEMQKRVWL